MDNGEDATSTVESSRYVDRQNPQNVVDADWVPAGKGDDLEAWHLKDPGVDVEEAQVERRNRADTAGPSNWQPRGGTEAERPANTFWGLPESESREYGEGYPPEGLSMDEWQRIRAEIESDWGPSTWQPSGLLFRILLQPLLASVFSYQRILPRIVFSIKNRCERKVAVWFVHQFVLPLSSKSHLLYSIVCGYQTINSK